MSWSWIVNNVIEPTGYFVFPVLVYVAILAIFRFGQFIQRTNQRNETMSEVTKDAKETSHNLSIISANNKEASRNISIIIAENKETSRNLSALSVKVDKVSDDVSASTAENKETSRNLSIISANNKETSRNLSILSVKVDALSVKVDKVSDDVSALTAESKSRSRDISILTANVNALTVKQDEKILGQDEKISEVTKEAKETSRNLSALTVKSGVLTTKVDVVYRYMDLASLQPNAGNSPLALTSVGKKMVSSLDAHKMLAKYLPTLIMWIDEKKIGTAYDIQMHSVDITRYYMLQLLDEDDLIKVKDEAYRRNMPLEIVMEVFATLLRDAVFNERGMPLPFPKSKAVAKGTVAKKRSK